MEKTLVKPEVKTPDCKMSKRCSCYDSDCDTIESHSGCYVGINKKGESIGVADGYCPFIHNQN